VFSEAGERELFASESISYRAWLQLVDEAPIADVRAGDVVALRIAPSAASVALLWALFERGAIVGLLGPHDDAEQAVQRLHAQWLYDGALRRTNETARHALYERLSGRAGLVLFTSGSSGVPKAALHDAERFLSKFTRRGRDLRTLLFLPLHHVGGLDTLFYAMANSSALIVPQSRAPEDVIAAISTFRADVLPTNPGFLNLLLLHPVELPSLKVITYGAEVMPQQTLDRLRAAFPDVKLVQRYGSTEAGALRTQARAEGSLYIKYGDGVQTRVVDGLLQLKAPTTMLGYLNAEQQPFDDGWLTTGDLVDVDGEYFRILGRASDLINVGGEKVIPAEVEQAVLTLPGVQDVIAYAEPNALLGQVVAVQVVYSGSERGGQLSALLRKHCMARLAPYKVPMRVIAVDALALGEQKKLRPRAGGAT
jgi:acyl-CoA synthetase (AMP-forming)/AMP-acid ligase II